MARPSASFRRFGDLPLRLQKLIWMATLRDQPSAVHFATADSTDFPRPERKWWRRHRKHSHPTVLEVLEYSASLNLPSLWTAVDALRQTCRISRGVALWHIEQCGPERMLELYRASGGQRASALLGLRGSGVPRHKSQPAGSRHADFPAPRRVGLPSSQLVDNSRDLVIMRPPWHGALREIRLGDKRPEWTVPIQRVRYLAVFHDLPRVELTVDKMKLLMFQRFQPEMLYIVVRPEFLEPAENHRPKTPEFKADMWMEVVAAEHSLSNNPHPDRFWHWGKEYYALKWDDVVDLVRSCPNLHQLVKNMGEVWMDAREKNCGGCGDPHCRRRPEVRPAAWKIMTWRDHQVGAQSWADFWREQN